jgi:fructokinase
VGQEYFEKANVAEMRIGIDIGGTKIEGIALGGDGQTLFRERIPTPAGDYTATVAAVVSLVDRIEHETGRPGSIGIGIPGTLSPDTGLVKNANSTCLNGKPLDTDLHDALGRAVRIANDADCFALSEAADGAGAGYPSVFGVILGTGVGGGLVIDGTLLAGPNAIAGEWGHNTLPFTDIERGDDKRYSPPPCYCGRTGCIETYLSGPGLTGQFFAETGRDAAPDEIAAMADQGDPQSKAILKKYEHNLARALSMVINIVDPAAIVLGGGLSNLSRLYDNVPEFWSGHVFSDTVRTALLPPVHGDSSGVRGAAWLWAPLS